MQINSINNNSAYNPGVSNPQSASIEQKIEKLEDRKRKIEEDLNKRSTNPDPKAAQGDNAANSAVNRRILQQIETQIETLEQRRSSSTNEGTSSKSVKEHIRVDNTTSKGVYVDLIA